MSVRQLPFVKDSRTCQFAKDHSPKICQRISSRNTIRQIFAKIVGSQKTIRRRFANVSVCQAIRQRSTKVSVHQKPFTKDSPTCQFAKNHSPKIRQRVCSPKPIPQRFANVSVRQGAFAKGSQSCQFAKAMRLRFVNVLLRQ